jgi:integration host factor subunit beta
MIKSQLVQKISRQHPTLYERDVEKVINAVLDTIANGLRGRDRVELRGFGVFHVSERAARTGRNPRSGQEVEIEAKRFPSFKASREMRRRLNPDLKRVK